MLVICRWTMARSSRRLGRHIRKTINRAGIKPKKDEHTINIRHGAVILVFHEHITKLELHSIHILTGDVHLGKSSPAGVAVVENVADLLGKKAVNLREVMLIDRQ